MSLQHPHDTRTHRLSVPQTCATLEHHTHAGTAVRTAETHTSSTEPKGGHCSAHAHCEVADGSTLLPFLRCDLRRDVLARPGVHTPGVAAFPLKTRCQQSTQKPSAASTLQRLHHRQRSHTAAPPSLPVPNPLLCRTQPSNLLCRATKAVSTTPWQAERAQAHVPHTLFNQIHAGRRRACANALQGTSSTQPRCLTVTATIRTLLNSAQRTRDFKFSTAAESTPRLPS